MLLELIILLEFFKIIFLKSLFFQLQNNIIFLANHARVSTIIYWYSYLFICSLVLMKFRATRDECSIRLTYGVSVKIWFIPTGICLVFLILAVYCLRVSKQQICQMKIVNIMKKLKKKTHLNMQNEKICKNIKGWGCRLYEFRDNKYNHLIQFLNVT